MVRPHIPMCTTVHPLTQNALPSSQYKFIVDGEWKYDPNQPAMFDEMGNVGVHSFMCWTLPRASLISSPTPLSPPPLGEQRD